MGAPDCDGTFTAEGLRECAFVWGCFGFRSETSIFFIRVACAGELLYLNIWSMSLQS